MVKVPAPCPRLSPSAYHQGHREHSLLHEPADGFQEPAAGARAQSAAAEPEAAATDPTEPGNPAQREWRTAERGERVQVAIPKPPLELPHCSRAPPLRQDRQPRWVPRKATLPGLGERRVSSRAWAGECREDVSEVSGFRDRPEDHQQAWCRALT